MTQEILPHSRSQRFMGVVTLIVSVALLAACGAKKDASASQTAARVNKDEITVHQINFMLQQQRGLRPEEVDAASKLILEGLIKKQLLLQKADELRLDRDPPVMQQIEVGRADVLARAVIERLGDAVAKPSPEDVKKYFDAKPALFSDRHVYSLQEINVETKSEQVPKLREKLAATKNITEFVEYLKASDMRFAGEQAVRAAEQLPEDRLDAIYKLKDGQAILNQSPKGAQVLVLVGSRSQPVTEEQARPAIEQFLLNERKRKVVEDELKLLRASAKIDYVGKFAEAASAAGGAASAAAPKAAASAGLSAEDVSKGMGLK